jgi:acyl-coenzyme A thioesterase PaaI-like protein
VKDNGLGGDMFDETSEEEQRARDEAEESYALMTPDLARVLKALRPDITIVDGVATGSFNPQPEHWGRTGWLHGGFAAAVLDHLCARAASGALGWGVVTGYLDLRYPSPVTLSGGPYPLEATTETPLGRMVKVNGAIKDRSGQPLVEAKALFVKV